MSKNNEKLKILIATAFPTHGAGSGALVTTQAKSYVEDGHQVHIITGNNRTNFDKLEGVDYHVVPFTAETEDAEKIEGQLPFNYLMFTTHTESTANFWSVGLKQLEEYCKAFQKALKDEVKTFNPDVIHAQHNWLLSSSATEMGKPVVTTIHGTDLMGYEKSKTKLEDVKSQISAIHSQAKNGEGNINIDDLSKIEEIYMRSSNSDEIVSKIGEAIKDKSIQISKVDVMKLMQLYDEKRKYEFYISEAEKSAKASDKIIVISEDQKRKFTELFPYAKDKVELLENGYDSKVFYMDSDVKKEDVIPTLTSNRTPDGKIDMDYDSLILFVGKFADFKGIDSLLTAAKQYETSMGKEGKKPLTIIVGSGNLEETLKAQADQLQLENTHFVGRKPHDVICKLQNLADVSVIPSRNEPFGLVVIEGTACGHPVIGSNSGGIPDILNTSKETLPNQDVIQTPLGVLIKPLPDRPESLTDNQKAELDVITTDYVMADEEEREKIVKQAQTKFNLSQEELSNYFTEYTQSTTALSTAVEKTVNGEFEFDNQYIHDYTEERFSQEIIRDRLIGIFNEAKDNNKNKSYEDD